MQMNSDRPGGLRGLSDRYPRLWALPAFLAMGSVGGLVHAVSDRPLWAAWSVAISAVLGLFFAFSKSEYANATMGEGDERQLAMHIEAGFYAYFALGTAVAIGAFREIARGELGLFVAMSFIGMASYTIAFLVLKRWR